MVNNSEDTVEKKGWRKASEVIEGFRNRRVDFIEPLSLALLTNRRDPITGLPGIPRGSNIEVAGPPNSGKTAIGENFFKNILNFNPEAKVAMLVFEDLDRERLLGLQDEGLDLDRTYILDYSSSSLETAEVGLNSLLELAQDKEVVAIIIDSLGAMAVSKEVYDKSGGLLGVSTNPQMAVRANITTKFYNQWITLDPNTRPTLVAINHMKDQIDNTDFSTFQLQTVQVGKDINLVTPCGTGKNFHQHMRIKCNGKKWPPPKSTDPKHELFEYREQRGLEVHIEVFRNRFYAGAKKVKGVLDFTDPKHVRFDLEDEVISYASYLDIDGISDKGNGRVVFPPLGDKSYRRKECIAYLREHQEMKWGLIKKIALQTERLFRVGKKEVEEKL